MFLSARTETHFQILAVYKISTQLLKLAPKT